MGLEIFLEKNLFLCMSLPQVYITFDHLRCMLLHFLLIAHDCTLIPLPVGSSMEGPQEAWNADVEYLARGLKGRCTVYCLKHLAFPIHKECQVMYRVNGS